MFSNRVYSKVALINDEPIYVDPLGNIVGYAGQCVTDLRVAVDTSVWAVACPNSTS